MTQSGVVTQAATCEGDADLATVGALLADRARASVLLALGDGRALPASMLATEAGVAPSTASHHLARLLDGGLITCAAKGRHRYYRLAGPEVAELLEVVARLAPARPIASLREGTRAHSLRYARSCYDHLAGRLATAVLAAMRTRQLVVDVPGAGGGYVLSGEGADWFAALGVTVTAGQPARGCEDWTEQRPHLAGPLGRQLLRLLVDGEWLVRHPRTRALRVTPTGRARFAEQLGIDVDHP